MNSERIKEIQLGTAYPESISVKEALLKVWNECQQENNKQIAELKAEIERLKETIDIHAKHFKPASEFYDKK